MGLAYLAESSTGKVIGFSVNQLKGYRGETLKELELAAGTKFWYETDDAGQVIRLSQKRVAAAAGSR